MRRKPLPYTNASELARLAGRAKDRDGRPLSRERIGQLLASGAIKGVRVWIGNHAAWRIRCTEATRWLAERGIAPPVWVYREGAVGAVEDIWIGS